MVLKFLFSEQGHLLANCRIEREKLYPGPGLEPGPIALRTSALTTELSGQILIRDRISLL